MRPWGDVHVEVHTSQTQPRLCGLHWSTPSRLSRRGGCGRTSSAVSTGRGWVVVSGPRRSSPDRAAAHHNASSMTTSQTSNDPNRQGILPAARDKGLRPDHR